MILIELKNIFDSFYKIQLTYKESAITFYAEDRDFKQSLF